MNVTERRNVKDLGGGSVRGRGRGAGVFGVCILIGMVSSILAVTCPSGYYVSGTDCLECHQTCLECTDSNSCDTCNEFMYLNSTTGLCTFCDTDQYYSESSTRLRHLADGSCMDCNSSCLNKCSYRDVCFDCSVGESYDLTRMECVSSCGAGTVQITDAKLHNKPICRSLTYFVNVNSKSFLELGTQSHPYKNLELALSEIFSFHSHSERDITIKIMENTDNYIGLRIFKLLNITSVTLEPYTSLTSSPTTTNLYFQASSSFTPSPTTLFNIMSSAMDQDPLGGFNPSSLIVLDESQFDNPEEAYLVMNSKSGFLVWRTSLFISGVNLLSGVEEGAEHVQLGTHLIHIVNGKGKTISLKSLAVKVAQLGGSGFVVLHNYGQGTSLVMENLEIDFHAMQHGIENHQYCYDSTTHVESSVLMINVSAYNSQERTHLALSYFYLNGNSNITISNSKFNIHKSSNNDEGVIEIKTTESCFVSNYPHYVEISDNEFTLETNPYGYRFNNIEIRSFVSSSRRYLTSVSQETVKISNNIFKNILSSSHSIVIAEMESIANIELSGNSFVNVSL